MRALLRTIVCKFGHDPAISLQEEAIFVKLQKCPYHVTFDLDLDLEHTLDAGPSGDQRAQVWCDRVMFVVEEAICAKFTDRQTDGRRTPRDCISSWNELKIGICLT